MAWTIQLVLNETGIRFRILAAEPIYSSCNVIPKHVYADLSFLALPIPILLVRYNYFLFYILRV